MQELFTKEVNKHDLRNNRTWKSHNVQTGSYGTETISNMGPKNLRPCTNLNKGIHLVKSAQIIKKKVDT